LPPFLACIFCGGFWRRHNLSPPFFFLGPCLFFMFLGQFPVLRVHPVLFCGTVLTTTFLIGLFFLFVNGTIPLRRECPCVGVWERILSPVHICVDYPMLRFCRCESSPAKQGFVGGHPFAKYCSVTVGISGLEAFGRQ